MKQQDFGVRMTEHGSDCGAAACKYVLIMLGVAEQGDSRREIMNTVRTAWGTDVFGSTPANIGNYIKEQCREAGKPVIVERANGHNPVGHVGGRGYLWVLGPAMTQFSKSSIASNDPDVTINWTPGHGSPQLAIMRMVAPKEGGYCKPHWVVQTFFGGRIQVMDPDGGSITKVDSFAAWMDLLIPDKKSTRWRSLNLDLNIWG